MSFTWVNGRQLGALQKGDLNVSYSYNSDGLRVSKTVNGVKTEYVWDGSSLIGQKTGNNVLVYLYAADGLAGFQYNGVNYYYLKNGQGDVVAILKASGNIVAKYAYDAWGKLLNVTDAAGTDKSTDASFIGNINPIRYRSYYYDTETGLYYLQSRYYDPEVGRFINADSLISGTNSSVQGYNVFVYCFNNPVNMEDDAGNWPQWVENIANGFKDGVKWVADKVVKPVVKKVESALEKTDIVITNGYTANAAAIPSGSAGISLNIDSKGNVAIQTTVGGGAGTPTAGISNNFGLMSAPDIYALEGLGGQYGGSVAIGPVAAGAEYVNAFDQLNGKTYHGFSLSAGVGAPVPVEFHGEVTNTSTLYTFNIFDEMRNIYHKIMEW